MILCIGTTPTLQRSLTFHHLTLNEVNRAAECADYASGKSINVARVLHTLGLSATCTGFLGGPRGNAIRAELSAANIPHDFVDVPAAPTRLCTTLIDRATHTATELVEESAPVPPDAWPALDARIASLAPTAKVAVLSGSLPPGADPSAYDRWIKTLHAQNTTVILDTRSEPARRALSNERLVIKMNHQELSETLKKELSRDTASLKQQMLQALTPKGLLIITLGKQGALATNGQTFFQVTPPPITPVSAVGSGDSFAAGLAAALYNQLPLPDSLKLASACGTANALTPLAGHVLRQDLDRILRDTIVSPA